MIVVIDEINESFVMVRVGVGQRENFNLATVLSNKRLGGWAISLSDLEAVDNHPVIWWDAEEDGLSLARAEDEHIEQVGRFRQKFSELSFRRKLMKNLKLCPFFS